MSRAFSPPDSLNDDNVRTLATVRRDIWVGGFHGWGYGMLAGVVGHTAASLIGKRFPNHAPSAFVNLNRNTAMASIFIGGALGALIRSTAAGKDQVHNLHPIFQIGAKPAESKVDQPLQSQSYQEALQQRQRENEEERRLRERNRMMRRKTLHQSMQSRRGLSDSHGGKWASDDPTYVTGLGDSAKK